MVVNRGAVRVATVPAIDRYPNPYLRLLFEHLAPLGLVPFDESAEGVPDIIHVHWPEVLLEGRFRPPLALAGLARRFRRTRAAGGLVLWTVHNVRPHDLSSPWVRRAYGWLAGNVDGIITMSQHAADQLVAEHRRARKVPTLVVGHGEMRGVHGRPVGRDVARLTLDIPLGVPTWAFFGQARPYKGIDTLVKAFLTIPSEGRLLLAGRPGSAADREVMAAGVRQDRRVRMIDEFLDDDALATVLGAADLVVLPYRDVTHSGSLITALSYDRPVLTTAVGALPEWQQALGRDWVTIADGPIDRTALVETMEAARAAPAGRQWPVPRDQHWPVIAQAIVDFVGDLARDREQRPER